MGCLAALNRLVAAKRQAKVDAAADPAAALAAADGGGGGSSELGVPQCYMANKHMCPCCQRGRSCECCDDGER